MSAATAFAALLLAAQPAGTPAIEVSRTAGLRDGETVVVTGRGFDVEKGVYVAFCVDRGDGARPTPCGGGADTAGTGGGSRWVSSDPPPYGEGLAVGYGPGGTFRVELAVAARIGEHDCRKVRCAVVTRADHTRTDDRSQDTKVPVAFTAPAGTSLPAVAVAGAGVAAAGAGAGAVVLATRRRRVRP